MIPFSSGWWQAVVRAILDPATKQLLELSEELHAAVVLELDRPEWGFYKQESRYAPIISQAAGGAGVLSGVAIRNPRDSGMLAVVEFIRNTTAAAVDIFIGHNGSSDLVPGEIAAVPSGQPQDTRNTTENSAAPGATRQVRCLSAPGIGGGFFALSDSLAAGEKISLAQDGWVAILAPGGFCGIQPQLANAPVSGNFRVRERPMRAARYL